MDSQDFRMFMIQKLRAFESWAWKDAMENPHDYKNYVFSDWYKMFQTYVEENNSEKVV